MDGFTFRLQVVNGGDYVTVHQWLCYSKSINISTIALEASATGKENSHQKKKTQENCYKQYCNISFYPNLWQIFHDQ